MWLPCINETELSCGDEINTCVKCQSNCICTHIIMYTLVYGRYYFYDRRLTMSDLKVLNTKYENRVTTTKTRISRQQRHYPGGFHRQLEFSRPFSGNYDIVPNIVESGLWLFTRTIICWKRKLNCFFWKTYNNLIAFVTKMYFYTFN